MRYEVVTFGNPILRVRAAPVNDITSDLKRMVDDMMETMYGHNGVGLAAQQIGKALSVCVIEIPPQLDVAEEDGPRLNPDVAMPLVMFNPQIVARAAAVRKGDEGCLSFPGIHTAVQRAEEITVKFEDLRGATRILQVKGFVARAVQHELDHLNGVLLVDRMSTVKRISLAGQLKRLRAETAARLEEERRKEP